MKDKLTAIAPFFIIVTLVLGFGFIQGWFSGAPQEKLDVVVAEAQTPQDESKPYPPWSTYHGDEQLSGTINWDLPDAPRRRWRFQANGPIYHGPVSSEKLIHFVTGKGEVFGVSTDGVKAWSRQLTRISPIDQKEKNARVDGPVSCFKETVLVGTMAGVIYALDASTGEEKWRTDIDNTILGAVNYQPATNSRPDRLYVIGQDDGALHSLNLSDGEHVWASEPIDRCDGSPSSGAGILAFGSCASALHVVSADDGKILKDVPLGDEAQVAGGVAIRGDSVFSGSHSGQVFHADMAKGQVLWTNEDAQSEVFTTPAVSENLVVFGSMDDFFYALDRATGTLRWKFETNGLTMSPVIANEKVVASSGGVLYLLSHETGAKLWSFEVSDEITSPSIIDGMIVVGSDEGSVSAFGE
jgi:eukaryotic-like serine/threonine-protein kinase